MEQETIRELMTEFDRIRLCLKREIKEVSKLIDAMNEAASQLKMSEGDQTKEFVSIKKVTAKADNVENEQQRANLSFTADQNIKTFLQQLQALGKVSSFTLTIPTQKDSHYKIKQQRKIDVKLVNDTLNCNIYGSCVTEDDSILLTDYTNQKLKRLDMSTETVKDYLSLPAPPKAVCLISNSEAAVTLSLIKTVQFVSLENKLTATRKLTLSHYCYGLVHSNNKLFISDSMNIVYIHDMNGKHLKTISTDFFGQQIFQESRHIAFSFAGSRVLVGDHNKGLVILDHQGKYLTTLTDPSVSCTHAVCTDGTNLFVCDFDSNNVVQIGQEYKLLGEIGNSPTSLCFNRHKTRLVVTACNNNDNKTNTITVLELE